jgi:hypothetical protein
MSSQKGGGDDDKVSLILGDQSQGKVNPTSEDYRARVTEHLQRLDRELQLRRQEQELQIQKIDQLEDKESPVPQPEPTHNFDLSQDARPLEIKNDLRPPSLNPDFKRDLDDHISYRLQLKQADSEYERIYRREYIKAFIENARKAGYKVRVTDDLDVIVERAPDGMK